MATTSRSSRRHQPQRADHNNSIEDAQAFVAQHDAREMTHDLAEYLTDYARRSPGTAALMCLGVGFLLGWKLKPW